MLVVTCSSCSSILRVKPEFAGKKLKCPRCSTLVPIPSADPKVLEDEFEVVEEEVEVDEEEEAKERKRREEEKKKKKSPYEPCPECGAEEPRRVHWTFWGRTYWTQKFTHVQCQKCGFTYNGKTGESNLIPAVVLIVLPMLFLLILVIVTLVILIREQII